MLRGEDCWPESVVGELEETVAGRPTYRGAPGSLYEAVRDMALRRRECTAVVEEDGRACSYTGLLERVGTVSAALERRGITRGSRLGCLLDNSLDLVVVLLAANALGAVFCPLPGKLRHHELVPLALRARLDLLVCEPERAERMRGAVEAEVLTPRSLVGGHVEGGAADGGARPHVREGADVAPANPEDTAILMFTSGTTARAKAVLLSNRAVVHAVISYERVLGVDERDRSLIAVPMYHITGLVAVIGLVLSVGGILHIHRRLRPRAFLEALVREGITFVHASPTVFAMLLEHREEFPVIDSVRLLASGAAHTPVRLVRALHEWMPQMEMRPVYGLTETASPATIFPGDAATSERIGSCGLPVPGLRVRILDEDGRECSGAQRGEICLSGTNLLTRYEAESADTGLGRDGWLRTGDIGYLAPGGYLFVVDRLKDMINRGGEKVWCIDVEEAIRSVEGVADCCVVGVADEVYGEAPAALVVRGSGRAAEELTAAGLRRCLREVLATYETPTRVLFVDSLPLTAGMKVDKRRAREMLGD